MFDRPETDENAILVNINFNDIHHDDNTQELVLLSESAGFNVVEKILSKRIQPDHKYFIGSGKINEIKDLKNTLEATTIIFNHDLSASQERNIEKVTGLRVFDRTALILYIFSLRAKTHEGKLQVELAHLEHLATRLTRGWSHLERQKGGIGVRGGPGEKQIELDRRMLRTRIKQLKEKLEKLKKQRNMQRRARHRSNILNVSIVGYTNAGKSTLFNYVTHEKILAENKLFATLDTTSRKLFIEPHHHLVISDTVGFIKSLPTTLIEAFKSTLEEATGADLLIHVVDISNPAKSDQISEVHKILKEIKADKIPQILILNQIDKIDAKADFDRDEYGNIIRIQLSSLTGDGIEFLKLALVEFNQKQLVIRDGQYV